MSQPIPFQTGYLPIVLFNLSKDGASPIEGVKRLAVTGIDGLAGFVPVFRSEAAAAKLYPKINMFTFQGGEKIYVPFVICHGGADFPSEADGFMMAFSSPEALEAHCRTAGYPFGKVLPFHLVPASLAGLSTISPGSNLGANQSTCEATSLLDVLNVHGCFWRN